jgi:hypothetical protein
MPPDDNGPNDQERNTVLASPAQRRFRIVLLAAGLLGLSGCSQVDLPFIGTPTPEPTPTPVTVAGPPGIGVDCATGKATGTDLASSLAVTSVSASLPEPPIDYIFTVRFGGVDSVQSAFYSALVLYDVSAPLLDPPTESWYFDNIGNVVYGFVYQPGLPDNTFRAVVTDAGWQESKATQFRAQVNANVLTIRVPAFEIPPGSHWAMALSDGDLVTCEAIGLGPDNLPALSLPPLR